MKDLVKSYLNEECADYFIIGFTHKHKVYAMKWNRENFVDLCTLDTNKNGKTVIRFKPNRTFCFKALTLGAEYITSEKHLDELVTEYKSIYPQFNRGHAFELLQCEKYGKVWTMNNICHKTAGDLNIDGIEVQVKFEGGTFATK